MSYPEALKKWALKQLNAEYGAMTFNHELMEVEFADNGSRCGTCGYEDLGVRIYAWRANPGERGAPRVDINRPFAQIIREILEEDNG